MKRFAYAASVVYVVCALGIGCGGGDKRETTLVSGTVTFAGKPLEEGNIVFDPVDGTGGSSMGAITNGKFEFESELGNKRVLINAVRVTEEKDQYGEPVTESYIPAKYNEESTLTAEVKADGENTFTFELEAE